ncbi:MAG: UvrB/UvrC motif-containing protein [Candidatus Eisenbacteria bacterium]|nr:UvrB/UvrC motif-containing protein [Candidatus Eisenbacteria bacterium]
MKSDNRKLLAAEVQETVPRATGVYALLDDGGHVLYVGKSVNLRQRMTSYFRRDPLTAEPHLGRLVAGIRSFAWWQTRSELLALLLEDVLIKEHLPPLNTRQREFAENRYLELTADDFPACLIVEHAPDFGARDVHGPLRDKYFAAVIQDVLHRTLGIRICSELEPVRQCLEYDIGRCAGPCRGELEPAEYLSDVTLARDFLRGSVEPVLDRLVNAMGKAAAQQQYEEAARLRDVIETCRRFGNHQRFAREFTKSDCRVCCAEDGVEYLFAKGALLAPRVVVVACGQSNRQAPASRAAFHAEAVGGRAASILHQPPTDRRLLADRTRIVCNWVRRRGDCCHVWFGDLEDPVREIPDGA